MRLFGFWVDTLVDFGLGLDMYGHWAGGLQSTSTSTKVIMYSTTLPGLFISFAVT